VCVCVCVCERSRVRLSECVFRCVCADVSLLSLSDIQQSSKYKDRRKGSLDVRSTTSRGSDGEMTLLTPDLWPSTQTPPLSQSPSPRRSFNM